MNINSNNLSFGSKIKFLNFHDWRRMKLVQQDVQYTGFPYTHEQIIKSKNGYTDIIVCCTAGGITDSNSVTMFHLKPTDSNISSFEEAENTLTEKTEITPENHNKFNGLIIGGKSKHLIEKEKPDNCKKLFNKIRDYFVKSKIKHSIFWEQKANNRAIAIDYKSEEDTWFIRVHHPYTIRNVINSISDLKNAFGIIKISEKDKEDGIWVNGDKLTEEQVDQLEQGEEELSELLETRS